MDTHDISDETDKRAEEIAFYYGQPSSETATALYRDVAAYGEQCRRAGAAAMRALADSNRIMDIAIKYGRSPTERIALGNEIKALMLEASGSLPPAAEAAASPNSKIAELERALARRDHQALLSRQYWVRAAKKAIDGDLGELRNRVALAEAPDIEIVQSSVAEAASPPTSVDVEKVCRGICKLEGVDPDELMHDYETEAHAYRPTDPRWTRYADAVMSGLSTEAASPANTKRRIYKRTGWANFYPIEDNGATTIVFNTESEARAVAALQNLPEPMFIKIQPTDDAEAASPAAAG